MNDEHTPKIGDRVMATMDGIHWYSGTYVAISDIFVQYGVLCDDTNSIRFFIDIKKQEGEK